MGPSGRTLMRYRPKSVAALHIALGGVPDKIPVEVDRDIGVSAKSVGELRKATVGEFGYINPAGTRSRRRSKGQQGQCSHSFLTETVGRRRGNRNEAARLHGAARRNGRVAACGARAAGGQVCPHWLLPVPQTAPEAIRCVSRGYESE